MRFADLDTTTEYAYRIGSKYSRAEKIRVQDTTQLWRQPVRKPWTPPDTPRLVPAKPGERATWGDYSTSKVGVLVSFPDRPDAQPELAFPARILSTWAEYEAEQALESERADRHRQARENQDRENARNSARIAELLKNHPDIQISAPDFKDRAVVSYPVLIRLLEALPDAAH